MSGEIGDRVSRIFAQAIGIDAAGIGTLDAEDVFGLRVQEVPAGSMLDAFRVRNAVVTGILEGIIDITLLEPKFVGATDGVLHVQGSGVSTGDISISTVGAGGQVLIDGSYSGILTINTMRELPTTDPPMRPRIQIGVLLGTIQIQQSDFVGTLDITGTGSTGDILVNLSGDILGDITIAGSMSGNILAGDEILGDVTINGQFDGDICGSNLSPGQQQLPSFIDIANFGPCGTICGVSPGCNTAMAPAAAEPGGIPKNRFISFVPGNAGEQTAIRVTLTSLYHPPDPVPPNAPDFSAFEGQFRWVGPPESLPECFDLGNYQDPNRFMGATLQCTPYYTDWPAALAELGVEVLHVYAGEIVPSSVYDVRVIHESCSDCVDTSFSSPLTVTAALWGDVTGNGSASFTDIGRVVDKFFCLLPPLKAEAMLRNGRFTGDPPANRGVSFKDIGMAVRAWRTIAYEGDFPACP